MMPSDGGVVVAGGPEASGLIRDRDGEFTMKRDRGERRACGMCGSLGARGVAVLTGCVVLLMTACTAGGVSSGAATRTGSLGVGNTLGARGSLEITTEAAVHDTTIASPTDAVWAALPTVFATLDIETPTVDARSLTVGNPEHSSARIEGSRMSTYFDCGTGLGGPNADRYEVTIYMMVQLLGPLAQGTMVRTVVDAFAKPRDVSGNAVHCVSKGVLERRVVELMTETVGGP
jgi:hypothetical protein